MGNLKVSSESTTSLRVTNDSTKSFIIPKKPLQIVSTMELEVLFGNNNWYFSLNGVTQEVKNLLDSGYTMQIQLVKDRGHLNGSHFLSPSIYKRPTYPAYIGVDEGQQDSVDENKKARIPINEFSNILYRGMNLTTWVNNMIYYSSLYYASNRGPIKTHVAEKGYWFTKVGFCILIDNKKYAQTNYITLNMKNNKQPINTSFNLINNTIDILAL
jgi:hypothetical protein